MEIISIIKTEMKLFSDFSAHSDDLGACGVPVSDVYATNLWTIGSDGLRSAALIVRLRRRAFCSALLSALDLELGQRTGWGREFDTQRCCISAGRSVEVEG